MKFPMHVMGKKTLSNRRNSLDTENKNNTLNTIMDSTQIINENERLAAPTSALLTAATPEMICSHENIAELGAPLEINNNIPASCRCLVRQCSSDSGGGDRGDEDLMSSRIPEGGRSRSNSQIDDSGFNSSASDDKDDECSYHICDNDKENLNKNLSHVTGPRKVYSDSQLTLLEAKCILKTTRSEGNLRSSNSPAPLTLPCSDSSRDTDNVATAAQRPGNHRRRHARQDQNNNTVRRKQLQSYFKKSPVHLQDCFQDKGFLCFAACIFYTLTLAALWSMFGVASATLKAAFGQEELNEIRDHIQAKRRHRPIRASGQTVQSTS